MRNSLCIVSEWQEKHSSTCFTGERKVVNISNTRETICSRQRLAICLRYVCKSPDKKLFRGHPFLWKFAHCVIPGGYRTNTNRTRTRTRVNGCFFTFPICSSFHWHGYGCRCRHGTRSTNKWMTGLYQIWNNVFKMSKGLAIYKQVTGILMVVIKLRKFITNVP